MVHAKALFAALLLALGACNGTDISPPADSAPHETACDSDTPPVTSGGTYGPQWQVGADDTSAIRLDLGNGADGPGGSSGGPPEIIPDDDPMSWTYNQLEDTYYRSPTSTEMVDNPWLSAHDLLLIPPRGVLQDLSAGEGNMDLPVPMFEEFGGRPQENLSFRTLLLGKTGTKNNVPFIEQRWEDDCLRRTTLGVSFSFYESRGFDPTDIEINDIIGAAISTTTRDSLAVLGTTKDLSFSLRGPYLPSRVDLEIPLPSTEPNFYVLKTVFDPTPAQFLVNSGTGSPIALDDSPSELSTQSRSRQSLLHLCFDGITNGEETDVDCGGTDCPPCGIGQECQQSNDCVSGFCWTPMGQLPGTCTSQCTDGFDNDDDGFADACDFNCVEHPDFGTNTVIHQVPLEHATTIGQFGTMRYCTINEQAYLTSFLEWSSIGTIILNNVIPDDETIQYNDEDRPPPFIVTMRGCVIADTASAAQACDAQTNACPTHPGYPLAAVNTENWGSANSGSLGQATGVLGQVWPLVDYIVEQGSAIDTSPIQIAIVYPYERDATASENGIAVRYIGPHTPNTAGAAVSNWNNPFAGRNFAHEVGHTIGLSHENGYGEGSLYPGTNHQGFMSSTAGPAPVLDADAISASESRDQWSVWLDSAAKEIPRASGFSFQQCNNDDSLCQNGHPGLTCDEDTQTCR